MRIRLLPAFAALSLLPACAGAMALDGGLRASIWDDNYRLGWGGSLGALIPAGGTEIGIHGNASHFAAKTEGWTAVNEFGGYLALYFSPNIGDQAFRLRLGPHVGAAYIESPFIDLGGDISAVFKTTPTLDFYVSFIPAWFLNLDSIGDSEALVRVGLGLQLNLGGGAAPRQEEGPAVP